jgi:hypothetical protein
LGIENDEEDVDRFILILEQIARNEKQARSANKTTPSLSKSVVEQQVNDFVRKASLRVFSL